MKKRFLSILFLAAVIATAPAVAQSHGPAAGANKDPLTEIADVTGKSSDGMSLIKSLHSNIKATGAKIPDSGPVGAIGTANKIMSVGAKMAGAYNKDGVTGAGGVLIKEAAGKVAGDYVNTAVGTTVTVWTAPVLGPLAPVAGTAAGFVAKKVTQTIVKGSLDSMANAVKTGKMPDPGQTLADKQYENTGGDRGWKKGDTYVTPDGKKHEIGPLIIKSDGTVKQTQGAVYLDGDGNLVRPPPKTRDNCIDKPTPPPGKQDSQGDLVYGPDGQTHTVSSKTPSGTPLPPGSYIDGKTGKIMTQNPNTGDWTGRDEKEYRNNVGLPPLKNDWGSTIGGLMSSSPGGCSGGPSGCSSSPTTTSSDSQKDKKDSSTTAGNSHTDLQKQQAPPSKNITIPPTTPVSDGTTMLAMDPLVIPAGSTCESDSSTTSGKTAQSSTSTSQTPPAKSTETKTTKTTETKTGAKPATADREGGVNYSIDDGTSSSGKSAAQDSAKSTAQDTAKTAAQDAVKNAGRPPAGGPPPGVGGGGGGCTGPCR
jgi:hypothetical protein